MRNPQEAQQMMNAYKEGLEKSKAETPAIGERSEENNVVPFPGSEQPKTSDWFMRMKTMVEQVRAAWGAKKTLDQKASKPSNTAPETDEPTVVPHHEL